MIRRSVVLFVVSLVAICCDGTFISSSDPSSTCGDLIVQDNEECDAGAGNGRDGVGCTADCKFPVCGDGHRAPGEYCDDGNQNSGDGCSSNCVTEHAFTRVPEPKGAKYNVVAPWATTIFGDSLRTFQSSEHFVIRASFDDQDLLEEELKEGGSLSKKNQRKNLATFERIWTTYIDKFKFAPPYFNKKKQYKVNVVVTDYGYLSGGTFSEAAPWPEGPHPQVQMLYEAFKSYGGMLHEFMHALQNMPPQSDWFEFGGWFSESHAEFMRYRADPTGVGCSEILVNAPHLYYGTTRNRYCNWQFWDYLAEVIGMDAINGLWTGSLGGVTDKLFPNYMDIPDACGQLDGPFSVLLRSLDWNIEQLNDIFGRWAMANVAWDYEQKGNIYRDAYKPYSEDFVSGRRGRVTRLESSGGNSNTLHYFPPEILAPQRWGYNLVRLIPVEGRDSVVLKFRGVTQNASARTKKFGNYNKEPSEMPQPDSGWRWGLVAIEASGLPRYSALQAGARASLRFNTKADDKELYLVVLGAPMSLHQIRWDQMAYSIYRYPWRIQLEGALPQGFEPSVFPPGVRGGAHPNGGGFVQTGAKVADNAYVGPRARVLDNAQIGSGVRIEGHAIIRGNAKVIGEARVKGHALLEGSAVVSDNAIVHGSAQMKGGSVYGNAEVGGITYICCDTKIFGSARVLSTSVERPLRGDARIFGDAQLLGDVEFSVENISSGVWYGFVHPEFMGKPRWGSDRSNPEPEVTASTTGIKWDTDDADCRYAHVGCQINKSCIQVANGFECVAGATAPKSYERSHKEKVVKCVIDDCENDKNYKYKGKYSCVWVAKIARRRKNMCTKVKDVQRSCPISCGFCCEDSKSFEYKNKGGCSWVAKKKNRIKKLCKKNAVKSSCRKTCDSCFDVV